MMTNPQVQYRMKMQIHMTQKIAIRARISSKLLPMMLCCAILSLHVFLCCVAKITTRAKHQMIARQQATLTPRSINVSQMTSHQANVCHFFVTHRGQTAMIPMYPTNVLSRVLRFVQYVPSSAALPVEAYQTLLIPTYCILPYTHQAFLPDMFENRIMEKI